MARSHSTNPARYTNPEVRFERTDIEYQSVLVFGIVLALSILLVVLAMFWYGRALLGMERSRKETDLPPAAVDANRLPPEPRLEALEDIREGKVQLFPPRAEEYFAAQRQLLEKGDPQKGILPMQTALEELPTLLKARPKTKEPALFHSQPPSSASSGRRGSGGS